MEPLEGKLFGYCMFCTSADKFKALHFLSSQQLEASKLLFQHHIKTQEALKFIQTPSSCWKKIRGLWRQAMNCLKEPSENKYLISGPLFTSWNVSSCSKSTSANETRGYVTSSKGGLQPTTGHLTSGAKSWPSDTPSPTALCSIKRHLRSPSVYKHVPLGMG